VTGIQFASVIECRRYDMIRYDNAIFTSTQKLTNSELNLPHATKKQSNEETKNKNQDAH